MPSAVAWWDRSGSRPELDREQAIAREPQADTPAADRHWDLLLVCIAAYVVTSVGRIHEVFPGLQTIRPAVVAGLMAIILYLADGREERRAHLLSLPITKYLIALVAWMSLASSVALVRGESVAVTANFAKTAVMFVVIAGAVRGPRDLKRLSVSYLLATTAYAVVVMVRFPEGAGDDWRLGHLYYYDANDFATVIVTALPMALFFAHSSRSVIGRLAAVASLAVLTVAFVRTGSRGGFLALLVITAFIIARYSAIPLRWRIGVTVLAAAVLLGSASDKYWDAMGTIMSDTDYNRTTETGRLNIWRRGITYMLQSPVFGVGPGNFNAAEGMLSPHAPRQQFGVGVRWSAPHNSYVQAGAELGVPGLIIFLALLAHTLGALRSAGGDTDDTEDAEETSADLSQALTAAVLGYVVGAFFLTLAYSEFLYTLAAMAAAAQKVRRLRPAA